MSRNNHFRSNDRRSDNIHDLDLELQLLKRKRELLEEQQQLQFRSSLAPTRFQNDRRNFDRPNFDRPRNFNYSNDYHPPTSSSFDSLQTYSKLYDDGPNYRPNKRFTDSPWQSDSGKRLPPPRKRQRSAKGAEMGPKIFNESGPSQASHTSIFRKSNIPQLKKNVDKTFNNASKITKPKGSHVVPNKLSSYSATERAALVQKTSQLTKPADLVFRANRKSSSRLLGRLEYGLGNLLKEINKSFDNNKEYQEFCINFKNQKLVKQEIRERLWKILEGKYVGSGPEIIAIYRENYPIATDLDLFKIAKAKCDNSNENTKGAAESSAGILKQQIEHKLIESAKLYYKRNMYELLSSRLDVMFEKVQKLYDEENKALKEQNPELEQTTSNNKDLSVQSNGADETASTITETSPNNGTSEDINEKAEDSNNRKEPNDIVNETENKYITLGEDKKTDEKITNDQNNETVIIDENKDLSTEDQIKNTNSEDGTNKVTISVDKIKGIDGQLIDNTIAGDEKLPSGVNMGYIRTLLNRFMPSLLIKNKQKIIDILSSDNVYVETKAKIKETTNQINEKKVVAQTSDWHFVRILGIPHLPKKRRMEKFFETYQPVSIKKHKQRHNLLFVAFTDYDVVERILAFDGKTIGTSTLSIVLSVKKDKPTDAENAGNSNVQNSENNEVVVLDDPGNTSLGGDLNDQIENLLTTINNCEKSVEKNDNDEAMDSIPIADSVENSNNAAVQGEENHASNEAGDENAVHDNGTEVLADTDDVVIVSETKSDENDTKAPMKITRSSARLSGAVRS